MLSREEEKNNEKNRDTQANLEEGRDHICFQESKQTNKKVKLSQNKQTNLKVGRVHICFQDMMIPIGLYCF